MAAGLARKLMWVVTGSVTLVTLPFAVTAYHFLSRDTLQQEAARLAQQTQQVLRMENATQSQANLRLALAGMVLAGYAGERHWVLDQNRRLLLATDWPTATVAKEYAALLRRNPELEKLAQEDVPWGTQRAVKLEVDRQAYWVLISALDGSHWYHYRLVPLAQILASMRHTFNFMLVMTLLVGLMTGLLLEGAVRRNVVLRLEMLAQALRRFGSGERDTRVPIEGNDEITWAERDFDEMADNIERLRQVEAMLRSREQATLQSSLDGIHIMDMHGGVVEANPAFCRMLGYTYDEVLRLKVNAWDCDKSLEAWQQLFGQLVEHGQAMMVETTHRRRDGSCFPVEINTTTMWLDGKPYIWASSRDVSARRKAEELIRSNEERLRYMLETSPIAVRVVSCVDQRVKFANRRYARMLNVPLASVIGVSPARYYADHHDYEDVMAELQAGHVVTDRLMKLLIPGVGITWVLASYLRLEYGGESAVLGWFYDVTDLRKAEQELRIAAQAFETQEGIVVTDQHGRIIRVNHAFSRMTGYAADEVLGKKLATLKRGKQVPGFYRTLLKTLMREKSWQGEIMSLRKNGEPYPEGVTVTGVLAEDGRTNNYVAIFSDITERKRTEQQIHQLAFYDPLTNLPNRRLLLDRLQQAFASSARTGKYGALIFMDLDHFKTLNDTQGHDVGDLLLAEVARRTSERVRQDDTVARLGGDEFVVVLEALSKDAVEAGTLAEVVAEKIRHALEMPYMLKHVTHYSSPSIGIALFVGNQFKVDELLKFADAAMYQAKAAGRNTIRFYDPAMQAALEQRISLEAELRLAIPRGQLELFYQVQVNTQRQPVGVEVLLRWHHHSRGLVSPVEFVPLAEETGLIVPIGLWALQTACQQLTQWQDEPSLRHLSIAVNVSAKQFRQADFVSQVSNLIQETGVNPALLKLELTESTVLADVEEAIGKMHALKREGVTFSMDDFGTGYSSLSYLKRLPLDQIKIDQSFVRDIASDPNDAAIVQTIIAMSAALGLNVIAEGVETEEQREFLESRGCAYFQGYLFGRPLPIRALEMRLLELQHVLPQDSTP